MLKCLLLLFITSCTCNITLVHTTGQAQDLIDSTSTIETDVPVDVEVDDDIV